MSANESKEERNKRVVTEIWDGFYNNGDVNNFLRNVTKDFIWKSDTLFPVPGIIVGVDRAIDYTAKLSELLPGVYGQILILTASDDTVTLISHSHALRCNGYFGLPPIDRPINFHQFLFSKLTEDGKVQEQWFFYDRAHILQQLNVLPEVSVFGGPGSQRWPEYINPKFLYQNGEAQTKGSTIGTEVSLLGRILRLSRHVLFGPRNTTILRH